MLLPSFYAESFTIPRATSRGRWSLGAQFRLANKAWGRTEARDNGAGRGSASGIVEDTEGRLATIENRPHATWRTTDSIAAGRRDDLIRGSQRWLEIYASRIHDNSAPVMMETKPLFRGFGDTMRLSVPHMVATNSVSLEVAMVSSMSRPGVRSLTTLADESSLDSRSDPGHWRHDPRFVKYMKTPRKRNLKRSARKRGLFFFSPFEEPLRFFVTAVMLGYTMYYVFNLKAGETLPEQRRRLLRDKLYTEFGFTEADLDEIEACPSEAVADPAENDLLSDKDAEAYAKAMDLLLEPKSAGRSSLALIRPFLQGSEDLLIENPVTRTHPAVRALLHERAREAPLPAEVHVVVPLEPQGNTTDCPGPDVFPSTANLTHNTASCANATTECDLTELLLRRGRHRLGDIPQFPGEDHGEVTGPRQNN